MKAFQLPKQTALFSIILANMLPIMGVIFWKWTPFYVFWLFWIETLIVAIFNSIKIIVCQGEEPNNPLQKSNVIHAYSHVKAKSHWGKAIKYLFIRLFIFGFYSIFIIVFIGFMVNNKTESTIKNMQVLAFANETFNYALLAFTLNQILQFFSNFILNDNYKKTHPSDFASIFDGRQLIIHIAVVLGGVLSQYLNKNNVNGLIIMICLVSIFCLLKLVYDIWNFTDTKNLFNTRKEISNQI